VRGQPVLPARATRQGRPTPMPLPLLVGMTLAVGQPAPPAAALPPVAKSAQGVAAPLTTESPYPAGRTFPQPDAEVPPPSAEEARAAGVTIALPASLFPPADQPAAAAPKPAATPARRALPPAFPSPPFPSSEYQGYPLIGLPPDTTQWPLMKAIQG